MKVFMSGFGRRNIFKSIVLYLCVSALFILPISTLLTSLPAFAAGYFDSLNTQGKYKFYVYARVMNACFTTAYHNAKFLHGIDEIKKGDIWKNEPSVYVGTFPGFAGYNSSGGYFECNSELINAAISQFNIQPKGRSSAAEVLLCEIGYRRAASKDDVDSCINSAGILHDPADLGSTRTGPLYSENEIFEVLTRLSGYKNGIENSDPSIKYLVSRSMIKGCIRDDKPQPQRHDSKDWEIPDVDSNGNLTNSYYIPGNGQGYNAGGSDNREWPQKHYNAKIPEWQCMNIYQRLVESAPKYQEALKQSATDTACAGLAGDKLKACKDGVNHKGDSAYCKDTYRNTEEINACKQGQSAEIETPSEGDGGEEEGKNSCGVDGIGWLVCPLMSFAGSLGDASYSAISYFLSIDKGIFEDQSNGGLEQAWKFFRDIANAVFTVIFLWVIFSQISNVGVSNYGIKKILPRLIIGALLVNLSFYLCQLAVDLSNILGFSLKGVLEGAASGVGTQSAEVGTFNTLIVGGLALVGVGLFIFLAVSIPTIMALLLALLVVLVILIVRQAAVILLIAISPLAFAAWLLPNTENLFKKWVSVFRGLLIVFPVISLLYGAGKLAGAVLAAVGTNDPNNPKETMQVAALAASILPLGATPFVLKSSLNSLGNFAGKLGGLSNLANKKLGGAIANKSRISDARNAWKSRSARKLAERRSGNTMYGRTARNLRKSSSWLKKSAGIAMNPAAALDNTPFGRKIGLSSGAGAAQEAYDKAAMEKAERALTYQYGGDATKALYDEKADKYTRIAAVNQLKGQGAHGADIVANYLRNGGEVDSVSMANALTEMKGSHAGVSEAGVSALKALQSGQSSFSLGQKDSSGNVIGDSAKDEFNSLTKEGVRKLSNEGIAKQSADAIEHSAIKRNDALKLLKDDRLRSMMSQDTKNALVNR
ncbi:hypothetical protein ACJ8XG_00060 [Candidatus Nanosynbacter lyticus]|uniref:hypothetical protein n=1 Tax=Candidatus Nanosynbacter lyticus TaxID=2093824 RepID=UPI0038CF7C86